MDSTQQKEHTCRQYHQSLQNAQGTWIQVLDKLKITGNQQHAQTEQKSGQENPAKCVQNGPLGLVSCANLS